MVLPGDICRYQPIPNSQAGLFFASTITRRYWNAKKAFLETFGYTVLVARSGDKGLELATIHSVDVVIVDYFMPKMNGHEVAIEMRRLRPMTPIIMLSAAVDVPEQALKVVGRVHRQGSSGEPIVTRDRTVTRRRTDPPAFGAGVLNLLGAESKQCSIHAHHPDFVTVINEARFLEPLHEKTNARAGGPHHFCQRLVTNLRDQGLLWPIPIEVSEQ